MWCIFGFCIFETSRCKKSCVLLLCDKRNYFNYILSIQKYLKCILLLTVDLGQCYEHSLNDATQHGKVQISHDNQPICFCFVAKKLKLKQYSCFHVSPIHIRDGNTLKPPILKGKFCTKCLSHYLFHSINFQFWYK